MAAVIDLPVQRPGAAPEDWQHFDLVLGLTADLLPVVSNPRATIAPDSTLKDLGKTPSRYNGARQAVGIGKWTEHVTTPAEIATWSRDRDLGLCVQTRRVRALDVDVTDPQLAAEIHAFIAQRVQLPMRSRSNASKFLVAFELPGELYKRRVKCASGMVEFLATGQQFIAVGQHPSGVRYEWSGGLPDAFPVLSLQQFEDLWAALSATFGIEAATESQASVKAQKLADAAAADPVAQFLLNAGQVKRTERDGRLHITCPFEAEHTGESGETSTTYWPAHTGGYANGHFRCLHAHCEHRQDQDFLDALGYVDEDLLTEFSAIADATEPQPITDKAEITIDTAAKPQRFQVLTAEQFAQGKPLTWLIKGVLPRAELGMVYGESTAGKTFAVLDMVAHIALGRTWRGHITRQVKVVYVIAEGASGMRYRLRAAAQALQLELADLPIRFIADAPNLLEKADALAVAKAIVAAGGADLVVLDTFAQVMAGGNENSGEDVGKVLAHCRGISKALGGAMVLPVHHSGKDTTRGARGWSGIKAAMDVELEVVAVEDRRSITVTKMKDGPGQGKEYGFRLETVVLGLDEDGEEITSCVVHPTEGGSSVRKVAKAKLGHFEQAVVDAVEELVGVSNEPAPLDEVLQVAISKVPHEGGEDRRRDNIRRAANNLVDKKGLLVRDGVGFRLKAGAA